MFFVFPKQFCPAEDGWKTSLTWLSNLHGWEWMHQEALVCVFAGGCVLMRTQCPSTSVTTTWVTSVRAPACWLELASLKRRSTSAGKAQWSWRWVVMFVKALGCLTRLLFAGTWAWWSPCKWKYPGQWCWSWRLGTSQCPDGWKVVSDCQRVKVTNGMDSFHVLKGTGNAYKFKSNNNGKPQTEAYNSDKLLPTVQILQRKAALHWYAPFYRSEVLTQST